MALHELGHALGLAHDSDTLSIMFPTLGSANLTLDATDIAGIKALYGKVGHAAFGAIDASAGHTALACVLPVHWHPIPPRKSRNCH